jgi:alanine dehydrogenase
MRVGVPKEIKDNERRVGLIPTSVAELRRDGHTVCVEAGAGEGAGLTDRDYCNAGAEIVGSAAEVFATADMIVKVKEPQLEERRLIRPGQILFAYLHLAPDLPQTRDLIESGAVCIAYETVTSDAGSLPLLTPMSEVAGRLAPQVGAHCLETSQNGRGVLLSGVPGVPPAEVVILGGGVAGSHAAAIALGMGAKVSVLDRSPVALKRLAAQFGSALSTAYATHAAIKELVLRADLLIGTVLVPGAEAPKLVSRNLVSQMKKGAVVVDVAIDQGGCIETSRPTSHTSPTYVVDGIVHYCVTNMPGAVARTSTFALNAVTFPFTLALANKGWLAALRDDPHLYNGLNVSGGRVTCAPVAAAHGLPLYGATSILTVS